MDAPLDPPPTRAEPSTPRLWTARSRRPEGKWLMRTDGLRPIVEALDREMSRVLACSGTTGVDETALLSSWAALVEFLALGPAREQRACPLCGSVGMRAATRCGACWRKLEPFAPLATA